MSKSITMKEVCSLATIFQHAGIEVVFDDAVPDDEAWIEHDGKVEKIKVRKDDE